MVKTHARRGLVLVGLCLALVGCDKKMELVFNNMTQQPVNVEFSVGRPHQFRPACSLTPLGQDRVRFKIDDDRLPVYCAWRGGGVQHEFPIHKDDPNTKYIYIRQSSPPIMRDEPTEIREEIRKEKTWIKSKDEPVVE